MNFLGTPLGYAISFIYKIIPNYALSIIIFTILLRFILIPMAIKQQKSMAKTSALSPYISEINKKYAKNVAKKNEELQKIYSKYNVNPASGCLPVILPFLVLIGMVDVIYRPLTHILHLDASVIDSAIEILKNTAKDIQIKGNGAIQLNLISDVLNNSDKYQSLGPDALEAIKSINLNFLGFNLGEKATFNSATIIFPILALVFSFLSIFVSFKTNSMPKTDNGNPAFKVMMFIMPVISIYISLTVPIGVTLYWIVGYVAQIIQTLILYKICNMDELKEKAIAEIEEIRKKNKPKKIDKTKTEEGLKEELNVNDNERLAKARKALYDKYDS